jgi:hypothetical protein
VNRRALLSRSSPRMLITLLYGNLTTEVEKPGPSAARALRDRLLLFPAPSLPRSAYN